MPRDHLLYRIEKVQPHGIRRLLLDAMHQNRLGEIWRTLKRERPDLRNVLLKLNTKEEVCHV